MLRGTTVTVMRPTATAVDRFGNNVYSYESEEVANVLVAPGATTELEAARPEGADVAFTLHFPRTYTGRLDGCKIMLAAPYAGEYRVIGDPTPYMDANTPTAWHLPVEIERAYG